MIPNTIRWGVTALSFAYGASAFAAIAPANFNYQMQAIYSGAEAVTTLTLSSQNSGSNLEGTFSAPGAAKLRTESDILSSKVEKKFCVNSNVPAAGTNTGSYALKVAGSNSDGGTFRLKATSQGADWFVAYSVKYGDAIMSHNVPQSFSNASFTADMTSQECPSFVNMVITPTQVIAPANRALGDSTEPLAFSDTLRMTLTPL